MRAALLCGAVIVLSACSDSSPRPAPSHRVVYRVVDTAGATPLVTTYVVERSGPYRGRVRTLSGPPPGQDVLGGTAWDGSRLYLLAAGGPSSVQHVAPGFIGADSTLEVSLPSASAHGLVRRTGSSTVASLSCDLWESRSPLDSASWVLPTSTDRVVSCVSADGLLLGEHWTLDGRLVRTRTAVSVGDGSSLEGTALLGGPVPQGLPTAPSLEEVKQVDADTLVNALGIPAPAPPQGFDLDRSVAVLQRELRGQPSVEGGVLVYRSGERLVELRLERGLGGRVLRLPTDGVAVTFPGGRSARLIPGMVGLRVVVLGGHGLLATVTADLDEAALLAWMASVNLP